MLLSKTDLVKLENKKGLKIEHALTMIMIKKMMIHGKVLIGTSQKKLQLMHL